MSKKDKDILDKFFNFLKKEVSPPIKKDFTWLGKIISEDLEKLTKEKKQSKNMKSTNVVAAIIKKDNQYLIVQRNKNKHLGLKWEFPGGKVDENESFESALKREIQEELNIEINIYKKIAEEAYKDEKIDIILHYYLCSQKNGNITLNEHESLAWVEKKDFEKYDFAEGDGNILSLL